MTRIFFPISFFTFLFVLPSLSAQDLGLRASSEEGILAYRRGEESFRRTTTLRRSEARKAIRNYEEAASYGVDSASLRLGELYEEGALGNPDYKKALEYYQRAAEFKLAEGIYRLGYFYEKGLGTPMNLHRAVAKYLDAYTLNHRSSFTALYRLKDTLPHFANADHLGFLRFQAQIGEPEGQFQYAKRLLMHPTEATQRKAHEFLQRAAQQGHAASLDLLGDLYLDGRGSERHLSRALRCYIRALLLGHKASAEKLKGYDLVKHLGPENEDLIEYKAFHEGDAQSLFRLGMFYHDGMRRKETPKRAFTLVKRAAELGYLPAQVMLGRFYFDGYTVKESPLEALKLWERAARKGSRDAFFEIGNYYYHFNGLSKAAYFYYRALNLGHKEAEVFLNKYALKNVKLIPNEIPRLEYLCNKGEQGGVACFRLYERLESYEPLRAEGFLEAAAQAHHPEANFILGRKYFLGEAHTPPNYRKALEYFQETNTHKFPEALKYRGIIYLRGHHNNGTPNMRQARFFLEAYQEHRPEDAEVALLLASHFQQQGFWNQSYSTLTSFLEKAKDNDSFSLDVVKAFMKRSEIWLDRNDSKAALQDLQEALQYAAARNMSDFKFNGTLYLRIADIHIRSKDLKEASTAIRRAETYGVKINETYQQFR